MQDALSSEKYSVIKDRRIDFEIAVDTGPFTAGHSRGVIVEIMVELDGIEPTTSGLQSPRSPS